MVVENTKKPVRNKYHRHSSALIWKSYLQRQRRWRLLLLETLFAAILFLLSIFIVNPVFLTPLQDTPQPPLKSYGIMARLNKKTILGYAPKNYPYDYFVERVRKHLDSEVIRGNTEKELNDILYKRVQGTSFDNPVIWVIFQENKSGKNLWKYSIRSTERALYMTRKKSSQNPYLDSGLLAVQYAINEMILSHSNKKSRRSHRVSLKTMPVSPLMDQDNVRRDIALLLLFFTLALLPPVLETQALVITETLNRFKRSLRIRGVNYAAMYTGWLVYAYLTVLPICVLASITLILIFRWVHLFYTFCIVLAYVSVMIMLALIMAMFHNSTSIACIWTTLFTLLQTFIAELIVHHGVDLQHELVTLFLHIIIPPLGLMHGFNEFALLQTGRILLHQNLWESNSMVYIILFWLIMNALYFGILMILQRTIKLHSIGGQVSWKSIMFKSVEDSNKLRQIERPFISDRMTLQEVDELVAKAISIRNVSKSIMQTRMLSNITLDIYRGEFTMIYSEPIQANMIYTIEDLLTGLTYPDRGSINILGEELTPGKMLVSTPNMLGYCHLNGCLVLDLTVQEHLTFYCSICLWNESNDFVSEYVHIRSIHLLEECQLKQLSNVYVRDLDTFYRAQLCWAIALLLEPRIVIIPSLPTNLVYTSVIKDKIMQYKKYITILKLCFTSISLEYADRVFVFDNRILVFGGTPAYMFFKYGREYRVRLIFQSGGRSNKGTVREILRITSAAGAVVRAHLGSLLILRLPVSPTSNVAALVKNLSDNFNKYGIISMNISVPDSEEVCNRAIYESRSSIHGTVETHERIKIALEYLREQPSWRRQNIFSLNINHMKYIWWKFVSYYLNHRLYFFATVLLALITGAFIGLSFATAFGDMERDMETSKTMHGEILNVEGLEQKTNLVLRSDNSEFGQSVARAYVFSETNATEKEVENMHYTALLYPESLTDYLVTRAIDSPQLYVQSFAYGLDLKEYISHFDVIYSDPWRVLRVGILYCPLHHESVAARSLARAYMALLRYYTNTLDATIQVTDDPLGLDVIAMLRTATVPPMLIQFLLILTITHIILIPSNESGFIRHMQSHAMEFSPARYWLTLFLCDFVLYCLLVTLMTAAMIVVIVFLAPMNFQYNDLAVVPIMLTVYGVGCIPQAYLFSLGPKVALNTMTFVMFNIILSETTVITKHLYGNAINYATNFFSFSPQYEMALAFMKIKTIFLYNSECIVFERNNLCPAKMLTKCCSHCGILQECFSKKYYLSIDSGVIMEAIFILNKAVFFMILLLLWEYKYCQRIWGYVISKWIYPNNDLYVRCPETFGVQQEKVKVINKIRDMKMERSDKKDTFGESFLASNLSLRDCGKSIIRDVNFGLRRGEVLAISGLSSYSRLRLCEMLAGPNPELVPLSPSQDLIMKPQEFVYNTAICQQKLYCRQVTLSCERPPLPGWMRVRDGLEMLAVLRGVPLRNARREVANYIDALELNNQADKEIRYLNSIDTARLHFAAAVVGSPPVVVLDECTAYQKFSVRRAMFYILYYLRKHGHSIVIGSSSVETHLAVTKRLAILERGCIFDMDEIDKLVQRYSEKGFTVVVHLKDVCSCVDVIKMFSRYFKNVIINDTLEVLVNVQVLDEDLSYATIFEKMEILQAQNQLVYSYVVSSTPIDYIYNSIVSHESGRIFDERPELPFYKLFFSQKPKITPTIEAFNNLIPFEKQFHITKLKGLPWSVIFKR